MPFSLNSSQGRVFCILVPSSGHVSLIVDQFDWQRCRSPCGTVVEWSWDHGESLRNLKTVIDSYCHLIDSHRHRSIHTRVVHGSGAACRDSSIIGFNGVAVWPATYQWCASLEWRYLTLRDYETVAMWFRAGLKPGEQERAGARLWPIWKDLRKKCGESCNLKTLKTHEELSASFGFCEKALRIDACA